MHFTKSWSLSRQTFLTPQMSSSEIFIKVEQTVRMKRSYVKYLEAARSIGRRIFLILKSMPFWISVRFRSKNFEHQVSLNMSISAKRSTIIIAAILAPSLCSASSMIIWTMSKACFWASTMVRHSFEILHRASTPSDQTCSSEFISIFDIIGKTCYVNYQRATDRGFSFWLINSLVNRAGSFWKNYSFRNSYSVEYRSNAGKTQSTTS